MEPVAAIPSCYSDEHSPNLKIYLLEGIADIILIHAFSDAFATTSPGGLQHHWVANLIAALQGLVY